MEISSHLIERLTRRLNGLVTGAEVLSALHRAFPTGRVPVGKSWILVKKLPSKVVLKDVSTIGHKITGDQIWVITNRKSKGDPGGVATVMLVNHDKIRVPGDMYFLG